MECPACHGVLTPVAAGGVSVGVCREGCGGMWFGRLALRRFDEPCEEAGRLLLDIKPSGSPVVDQTKPYSCPQCPDTPLHRHFFSVRRAVTVDDCPECGGVWLDPGELREIREEYGSEAEREAAAEAYFAEVFGGGLTAARARTEAELARAQRFANMFRFICPSHYIPGRQSWGAF